MSNSSSRNMIIIGGVMLITSLILAWLMVLHILTSTLFLNFLSMTLLVGGMVISAWGFFTFMAISRARQLYRNSLELPDHEDELGYPPDHSK